MVKNTICSKHFAAIYEHLRSIKKQARSKGMTLETHQRLADLRYFVKRTQLRFINDTLDLKAGIVQREIPPEDDFPGFFEEAVESGYLLEHFLNKLNERKFQPGSNLLPLPSPVRMPLVTPMEGSLPIMDIATPPPVTPPRSKLWKVSILKFKK